MSTKRITIAAFCLSAWLLPMSQASAAAPAWKAVGIHLPTHFAPGEDSAALMIVADNVGSKATSGTLTLTDTLPTGLTPTGVTETNSSDSSVTPEPECEATNTCAPECVLSVQTLTCTNEGPISPGRQWEVRVFFDVDPLAPVGEIPDTATLSGGGADTVEIDTTATISPTKAPFGFLAPQEGGPDVPATDADGHVVSAAGAHPYQITASLGFPTERPNDPVISAGHPRDITVDLSRGMVVDPAATPLLCTEAELVTMSTPGFGCPRASQVGTLTVTTFEAGGFKAATTPLYNMVPPPGAPAMLAFDAASVGVFVHLKGELRSDGDYGISSTSADALALTLHPIFGARADLWGNPSSPTHDKVRGACFIPIRDEKEGPCTTEPRETALLTMPSDCPGKPTVTRFHADSWERPGVFAEGSYESADLKGAPVSVDACNELKFEPSIEAKPTTNLADSPAGLEFNLHQPQAMKLGEDEKGRSTATLKGLTLTLPEGLVVNPSAAQVQQACSSAQIGLKTPVGQTAPINFFKTPASCPDAAKVGTVEVRSPLLAETDETKTKVQYDAKGNAIPRPLHGAVYLAKPFDNPFNSLLALYIDVEDPQTGIVTKFATKITPDPLSGRLTSTLTEAPELPIEDVHVSFFPGDRAALRTPPACATYTTNANLTPWSSPQAPDAQKSDSFLISGEPGGGPCPASPNAAANKPDFVAGTITPQAGAYSPFVLKVSREDGSQPIGGFEARLPKGLTAKLAGVPYCSEAQIAQAKARSHPNEGAIEQANPSCPAASEVGTVDVAAGAGPRPIHTSGRVYLAGPDKGAPVSFVIITPAIAGPFDLGAVVVRSAAYVDPETALVRVVSDPLPTILEGIPLDLRSAEVEMSRPNFTLNPTSCEPKTIGAITTSVFGQAASLSDHFQMLGCQSLGFKPTLSLRLKGSTKRAGHPALTAVANFKAGQANIDRASVALPHSEFLDQAHIGTVCTRVQFAAHACPAKAIYGFAKATTPLLDKPLEGPVYLRSSSHKLPDLVVALAGQIEVALVGRVDSVNGGIRNTFEAAPDAPVSKFTLEMRGGRKGLLENSTNLCLKANYASVKLTAQNAKTHSFKTPMKNDCKKKAGKQRRG
jgi:hypothetical protein